MKVNEFRIGNVIEDHTCKPPREKRIDITLLTKISERPSDKYKPAKLNERHLFKFGFSQQKVGFEIRYYLDDFYILKEGSKIEQYYIVVNEDTKFIIDFVHQLQNIYFVFMSNELNSTK